MTKYDILEHMFRYCTTITIQRGYVYEQAFTKYRFNRALHHRNLQYHYRTNDYDGDKNNVQLPQ